MWIRSRVKERSKVKPFENHVFAEKYPKNMCQLYRKRLKNIFMCNTYLWFAFLDNIGWYQSNIWRKHFFMWKKTRFELAEHVCSFWKWSKKRPKCMRNTGSCLSHKHYSWIRDRCTYVLRLVEDFHEGWQDLKSVIAIQIRYSIFHWFPW